ncbi:hypothetical protein TWF281_009355 [Arthrobotrys megalospora]
MMLFKISPAAAFAILASISDVSAHVRFVDAYGNYNPAVKGANLGHNPGITVKNHGTAQYPGQFDTIAFSNPIIPPCCGSPFKKLNRPRQYLGQGCGTSLSLIYHYYNNNNLRAPHPSNQVITPAKLKGAELWKHRNWHFFMGPIPAGAYAQTKALTLQYANGKQIAQATPGGWIEIVTFQVNTDGAGPFRCRLDETGTGQHFGSWLVIDKQPPPGFGSAGLKSKFPNGVGKRHFLRVQIPGKVQCKAQFGSVKNVCQLRCENIAQNGPFGGCVPFQVIYPQPQVVAAPEPKTVTVTVGQPEPTSEPADPGYDVGGDGYSEDGYSGGGSSEGSSSGGGYSTIEEKRKRDIEQKNARRAAVAEEGM